MLTPVAVALLIPGGGAVAETLGQVTFQSETEIAQFTVSDRFAGGQTAWGGNPEGGHTTFSLVGEHPDGTILTLKMDYSYGRIAYAWLDWLAPDGGRWVGSSNDTLSVSLIGYDASLVEASISGTITGSIRDSAGDEITVDGQFAARLPHFDFAPTPGPDDLAP